MQERAQLRTGSTRRVAWMPYCLAGLLLLALFLGGSTRPWSEGMVLAILGMLIALRPPQSFGSRALGIVLLGLIVLALTGILPAAWFGLPAWRLELTKQPGVQLPGTLSPQPWITMDSLILLVAGAAWIAWLQARPWKLEEQRRMFRLCGAGLALFAGVALAVYLFQINIPFWLATERKFGPFPNRNQTADVLALGSILTLALAYDAALARKKIALVWVGALAVLGAALVVNYSRAGIVVAFAGAGIWILMLVSLKPSLKWISVGASILLVMLAAFLFFGGETLGRFHGGGGVFGFRGLVYKDTFALIRSSPWCGVGLGNFDSLFALFRSASASETRVIHPESDWLWLWSEMGWPAVLLAGAGIALLARRVFPLTRGTNRRLRAAALAAALAATLHGIVDVSGHRLGSMLTALFIFSLALPPGMPRREDRRAPAVFRILGALIFAVGLAWVWATADGMPLPGRLAAELAKQKTKTLMENHDAAGAVASATAALRWIPLDWQLYFARGVARTMAGDWVAATGDFRRARFLETSSPDVPWQEAMIWAARQPDLALVAWRESLKRSAPGEAVKRYGLILDTISNDPALLARARALAGGNARLDAVWLEKTGPPDFDHYINNILQLDPELGSLPPGEQAALFVVWAARTGDPEGFLRTLERNPAWLRNGWRTVAGHEAAQGRFEAACKLAARFIAPPLLPKTIPDANARELRRRLGINPADFSAAYALYQIETGADRGDEALGILEQVVTQPECPGYFELLLAQLYAKRKEWEKSWNAYLAWQNWKPPERPFKTKKRS